MKKNTYSIFIVVFLIFPMMQLISFTRAQSTEIQLNYDKVFYNMDYFEEFDESNAGNASGAHEGVCHYFMSYEKDGFWIEEERFILREYNSSSRYVYEVTGNLSLGIKLDAFSVDVTYGDNLHFNWMAVRNGTTQMDYFITNYRKEINYTLGHHYTTNITYTKYDLNTREFIETWEEINEESGTEEHYVLVESDYDLWRFDTIHEFTAPMFLVTQVYKTVDNESAAWADLFWDYFIYEDTNLDSIYSLQGSNMYDSEECDGFAFPWARKRTIVSETFYDDPMMDTKNTYIDISPNDKDFEELADSIRINEPRLDGNVINWGIEYPEYPTEWHAGYSRSPENSSYSMMSPASYFYGFQYAIAEGEADFDYTIMFPKITNQSFYEEVQGRGLSLPHYTYFISPSEIKEGDGEDVISFPQEEFEFSIDDSIIAEITMLDKKEYQVNDYPIIGVDTVMNSSGGSVSSMLKSSIGSMYNPQFYHPMRSVLFSFKETDEVAGNPDFDSSLDLFCVTTQNYPLWSGEKLTHDPTLRVYFKSTITQDQIIGDPVFLFFVLASIGAGVILLGSKMKYTKHEE